jgi:hypothetical protein
VTAAGLTHEDRDSHFYFGKKKKKKEWGFSLFNNGVLCSYLVLINFMTQKYSKASQEYHEALKLYT